jgi:hemolysin D
VLTVRFNLDAKDVPNIHEGQPTLHKIEAYPYQRYGFFEGEVLSIERSGLNKGAIHYEVRASVRPPELPERLARDVRLVMGMKVDSQIITGKRTLYAILGASLFGQR